MNLKQNINQISTNLQISIYKWIGNNTCLLNSNYLYRSAKICSEMKNIGRTLG